MLLRSACGLISILCGFSLWSCAPRSVGGESAVAQGRVEGEGSPEDHSPDSTNESEAIHPLIDDRLPDPTRALPELTFEHLGMHIGGEPNDAESKRPWLDSIDAGKSALLSCYRFVDDPRKGGSYGVDLYVTTSGGAPEVRASRQKLGGEEFDRCMRDAFSQVKFHKPQRPTVLSYSLLFRLHE